MGVPLLTTVCEVACNYFVHVGPLSIFNAMNTDNFSRRARTLSFGRRTNYRELGLSASVENMAQLHPPHIEEAGVVDIHTRIMEPKR